MSVFIGDTLMDVLNSLEERIRDKKMTPDEKTELKLDIVGKIPEILQDNTDRNRTSPFAFTGNRFEFRAVGASGNCASPILVLNTAVAQQLERFKSEVDRLIEKDVKKDEAIFQILRLYITESKNVLFNGNGYSHSWHKEAEERGLKSITSVTEAFKAYLSPSSQKLFNDFDVLNHCELEARYEIKNEIFLKKLQIESRVLSDMAINHIIPTAIAYQNVLIANVKGMKEVFNDYSLSYSVQMNTLEILSKHINAIDEKVHQMINERKKANVIENIIERAEAYAKNVLPFMESIRYHIDKLEMIIDDELWPLPKYRELLFIH
jgi:glutamine synthetase